MPDLEVVNRLMAFKFDPVMYSVQSAEYRLDYTNKIIYYVIEVVSANSNITINQVCSLLRNTIQIPEELTRSTIVSILKASSECKIFKAYESAKDIKHLQLAPGYFSIQKQIAEKFPELLEYLAPVYKKKKREDISSIVEKFPKLLEYLAPVYKKKKMDDISSVGSTLMEVNG
jgi:SUMO ligase MMS21 Smc5/6 complex component